MAPAVTGGPGGDRGLGGGDGGGAAIEKLKPEHKAQTGTGCRVRISTNSVRGPETAGTTGISDDTDTRTGRRTPWPDGPFTTSQIQETAGQQRFISL